MRILQIVSSFKQRSGIANVLMNYYRFVDRTRVQFDFLVTEYDDNMKEEVENLGGRVYIIEKLSIRRAAAFSKGIEEFFYNHQGEYKVVHSHFYQIDFMLFPIAKKYGATHCIMHSHNTKYADYTLRKVRNCVLSKLSCGHATDFAACSEEAGSFLFGEEVTKKGKLYVLNNAIDAKRFAFDDVCRKQLREQLKIEDKYVIGHVGRFCGQKNHELLICVFAKYAKKDDNAVLILVGEGELEETVKAQVMRLGLSDKVLFLGTRTDVPALLQAMDCFVFPSRYEGLGMAVVEAQAAGLPCAASDAVPRVAAVTTLLDFFSLKETDSWVDWIGKVKNTERRDTSALLVQNGYDLMTQATALENYYLSMLNS